MATRKTSTKVRRPALGSKSANDKPLASAMAMERGALVAEQEKDARRGTKTPRATQPRTAGGKKADPGVLAAAAINSQEGFRERTEAGHIAAGRTPPSQRQPARVAGSARIVDDSIRNPVGPITEDQKLLQTPADAADFTRTDPWRVLRITGEFIEGFDALATVRKGVAIFGSARTHPDDPQYAAAQEVARLLAKAGFAIVTGGGPGIMEAANKGARLGGGRSIGCNIELPFEQGANPIRRYARELSLFLRAEDDVHQILECLHHLSRWLRDAGRGVRGAHADPDRQDLSVSGDHVRPPLLGGADSLAPVAGPRGTEDLSRRFGLDSPHGRPAAAAQAVIDATENLERVVPAG